VKPDLKKLDDYYQLFPKDIKDQGVIKFATYPPLNFPTKIADLWDGYLPIWRKHAEEDKNLSTISLEDDSELLKELEVKKNAMPFYGTGPLSSDDAKHLIISRKIRSRKGKWRTIPKKNSN